MPVVVVDKGWRKLKQKLESAPTLAVSSTLPYAAVAGDATLRAFKQTKVATLDAQAIGEDVLERAKVLCPVLTGALRDSLALEVDNA